MIYGSMPPETRKKQVERFIKGESKVIVSTDAIGMGLNLTDSTYCFFRE